MSPFTGNSFRVLVPLALAAMLTAGYPVTPAAAQGVNMFGDWSVVCEDAASTRCYISQNLALRESGQHLLHIGVGLAPDAGRPGMVITVPLGINLPPGILVTVDETPPVELAVQRCTPQGCHVNAPLSDVMLARLREGRWLTVEFQDAVGQRVVTPVSLVGFTRGLRRVTGW